jgi:hypothetical protein
MAKAPSPNQVPAGLGGAAIGIVVLGMGAFISGVGLGFVPVPPESVHAPGWVIAGAGLAFIAAGLSVVQQAFRIERFKYAPGLVIFLCLAAVAHWVAFAPGERESQGRLSVAGLEIPLSSGTVGRFGIGFGAAVMDLLLIAGLVKAFRKKPAGRAGASVQARRGARPGPGLPARSPARGVSGRR